MVVFGALAALVLGGMASLAAAVESRRDLVYGEAGGERLLLDASVPDGTVPLALSQAWQRRMPSAGNTCDLIVLKGAPHAQLPWEKSDPTWPAQMATWLRATLAAAPAGARK